MTGAEPDKQRQASTATLDIAGNRRATKWSAKALLGRGLWELAHPLFAWSPRQLWGWRNALLRLFGARIGPGVHIHPTVRIAVPWNLDVGADAAVGDGAILYSLGAIRIGERATVSQYAHLCAGSHDHEAPDMPLLKTPIVVGDEAWICTEAFIGPNVVVGERTVIGARAVLVRSAPANAVLAGNPARVIRTRQEAP